VNYSEFEAKAIAIKEAETEVFRAKAETAAQAADADKENGRGATRTLADLWGRSAHYINTLAQVWTMFPEDWITPDVPLSLYRAALETDAPLQWLERALAEGWSSRELRDAADIVKGKRTSRVLWLDCEADVIDGYNEQDPVVVIRPDNFIPSGKTPPRLKVKAWEVLLQ